MSDLDELAAAKSQRKPALSKPKQKPLTRWIFLGGMGILILIALIVFRSKPDDSHAAGLMDRVGSIIGVSDTIRGAVWVTRANGASDLQRGAKVILLRPLASRESVVVGMQKILELMNREAKEHREKSKTILADLRRYGLNIDTSRKEASEEDGLAAAIEGKAKSVLANIPKQGLPIGTQQGFELASHPETGYPFVDAIIEDTATAKSVSDAQGAYGFSGVGDGDYFLYCKIDNAVFTAIWLVPIKVGSGSGKIDLYNDNWKWSKSNLR